MTVSLTAGQIESFGLICLKQISCQYGAYLTQIENGLYDPSVDQNFYRINAMWRVIWLYNPLAENNCLTVEQIYYICIKLMQELCFTLVLEDLPETTINQPS